jgi:hypothetical protein
LALNGTRRIIAYGAARSINWITQKSGTADIKKLSVSNSADRAQTVPSLSVIKKGLRYLQGYYRFVFGCYAILLLFAQNSGLTMNADAAEGITPFLSENLASLQTGLNPGKVMRRIFPHWMQILRVRTCGR